MSKLRTGRGCKHAHGGIRRGICKAIASIVWQRKPRHSSAVLDPHLLRAVDLLGTEVAEVVAKRLAPALAGGRRQSPASKIAQ